ncbi:serine palmitoyltransferase 1-like [Artemia franciscana]|uniref:Serine palmitoyltransferase 1 n=1 Tax=Artemia franciscana TaxID=6661 RepID=A0AA88I9A6_ARTSF|nr:hypothetical protein QYM36_002746 [Artemia franciscana]
MNIFFLFQQVPTYHLFIEGVLFVWVLWLLLKKNSNPLEEKALTESEKEALIEEWTPEPIVPQDFVPDLNVINTPVVDGRIGKEIIVNSKKCLNLASHNYLGLSENRKIDEEIIQGIKQYGVGSCGPRGFYGTTEAHLDLEKKLAEFLGVEEVIHYSYGYSAIASAIPAYSKRGDVIFVDAGVSFPVQKSVEASRSDVYYFKHNDMEDLERVILKQIEKESQKLKKKAVRKFIVVEGIYLNTGDICKLPELIELKSKYKIRLFLEESVSFGVLGLTGKGVTEHFGIPIDHVDMIAANTEYALASIGGFCAGTSYVIDHQRLCGLGYCFSASLPPPIAVGTMEAVRILAEDTSVLLKLKEVCRFADVAFREAVPKLMLSGNPESPVKHLYLKESLGPRSTDKEILRKITEKALEKSVCFVCPSYLENLEKNLPPPSIRLSLNCHLSREEILNAANALSEAVTYIIN